MKAWVGRKTAEATRHLSRASCAEVDHQVSQYADRLFWGQIETIVEATWMRTDPDAAAEADRTAQESLGVWTSPSTEHGTKTMLSGPTLRT